MAKPTPPQRRDFPHFLAIPTRWMDNDIYGHVNNVVYLSFFDTVINHYLISVGGLDIQSGEAIGLCVESHCHYDQELTFPEVVDAGLRTTHLGNSSVRYEIGLFRAGVDQPAAHGWFVHVFVDRATHRPAPLPAKIRLALGEILASRPAAHDT